APRRRPSPKISNRKLSICVAWAAKPAGPRVVSAFPFFLSAGMNSPVASILLSMKTATLLILSLFAATFMFAAEPPAEGSKAPDFTLKSQDGTPVSLHDFKGKNVVLYFYPKDMTQGCTIEAHGFQRDLDKYTAKNAVILGVSVDTVESHQQFCAKDS